MRFLPDTNCCIEFLRGRNERLIARWQSAKASDIFLFSLVVYELRHGAERSSNPVREHGKLDRFAAPYSSLPFDDSCARKCAELRAQLERTGTPIGPYDFKSPRLRCITASLSLLTISSSSPEFVR